MSRNNTGRNCSFPDCGGPINAKGLCSAHYWQMRRGETLHAVVKKAKKFSAAIIAFDEVPCQRTDLKGPCHVFRGKKRAHGYCKISNLGVEEYVHRIVWIRANGPIPEGLEIDHQCCNKACCNIDHLRAVAHQVNSTENLSSPSMWQIMAAKTHCPKGHEYTPENTRKYGRGRWCRECARIRSRTRYLTTPRVRNKRRSANPA